MFYDQKLQNILNLLDLQPYWTSRELADRLGISRSTVQRCLEDLHRSGLVQRIHGGVRRNNAGLLLPVPPDERSQTDTAAKQEICCEAAKFLETGGYVYLDAGTTILPLAQQVTRSQYPNMHFVTNDVAIALALAQRDINHTLLGGRVHPVTQTISGPAGQAQVAEFHFDTCFISADGVDPEYGVTCSLNDEAHLKRQVMKQSVKKILLAAGAKWGRHLGSRIAKLEEFNVFITEQGTGKNSKMEKACRADGLELIIASEHQEKK